MRLRTKATPKRYGLSKRRVKPFFRGGSTANSWLDICSLFSIFSVLKAYTQKSQTQDAGKILVMIFKMR